MQRPEYRNVFAISQSAIKDFRRKTIHVFKDIHIDKKIEDDDDNKFAFGSLTDTLAFTPQLLEQRFYIADMKEEMPSDAIRKIVEWTFKKAAERVENTRLLNAQGNLPESIYVPLLEDISEFNDLVYECAKELKYGGTTWSKSRILDNVITDGREYFRLLSRTNGKQIITGYDNADAVDIVNILQSNKDVLKYFIQQENQTLLFQQEIFMDHVYEDGFIIPLKAALDIILLDHESRTVIVPDLKTTHNSETFRKIAKEFDYIIQADFYTFLVLKWLQTYEGGKYKDYTALPSINIAIDRKYKIPYIYEYDLDDLEIIRYGSKEQHIEGWLETLDKIKWHMQNGIWDRPKELYENGKIKLKLYR